MIHALAVPNPFAPSSARRSEFAWSGQTIAEIVESVWLPAFDGVPLTVTVNGGRVRRDQLDDPIADCAQVVVMPNPGWETVGTLVVYAVITFLVTWAYIKIAGVGVPEEVKRNEDDSQAYDLTGIHTEYREGLPIPILYGQHRIGGQALSLHVVPAGVAGGDERLEILIGLCAGPIAEVGGYSGDHDNLGDEFVPLPEGLQVNGNALQVATDVATVWLREGSDTQRPTPISSTWQIETVGDEIRTAGSEVKRTITDIDEKSAVDVILSFPSGVYTQNPQGNLLQIADGFGGVGVRIEILAAADGAAPVRLFFGSISQPVVTISPFTVARRVNLTGALRTASSLAVTVRRHTPFRTGEVSTCIVRQIQWQSAGTFSYPGIALLGLGLSASETSTGGRPNVTCEAKGKPVRVWDATINGGDPSESRYWEVPEAGDDYAGIWTYPPGRNPAWILADLLTDRKDSLLGEWFRDAQIDWPAFRNWADFCDQDATVLGVDEAYLICDVVLDSPTAADVWIERICRAGRGAWFRRGNLLSVRYTYRDAHGRGTNVVPARTRQHLVASSNVREFEITYTDTSRRPAVIIGQHFDAASDYAMRAVAVDDPESGVDDQTALNPIALRRETIELIGFTRRSQVLRELLFMHAANREIAASCTFVATPDILPAEIGDIVGVQHDVFRPFATQAYAARVTSATGSSTTFTIDRAIVLPSGAQIVTRNSDGDIVEATLATAAGSYAAGATLTVSGSAIDWLHGAPIAIGEDSAVVQDFEIVAIETAMDLTRKVTAVQYVPSIHDIWDIDDLMGETGPETDSPSAFGPSSDKLVTNVRARRLAGDRGQHLVTWLPPIGTVARAYRVHLRQAGEIAWGHVGDVATSSMTVSLSAGVTYEVSIVASDQPTGFAAAGTATVATVIGQEWPHESPMQIGAPSASWIDGATRALIEWQPAASGRVLDYEVRRGPQFLGAPVIARTRHPSVATDRVERYAEDDAVRFWVRARMDSGLLARPQSVDLTAVDPVGLVALQDEQVDLDDCTIENATTAQDLLSLRWSLSIDTDALWCTLETPVYELGYDLAALSWLTWDVWWRESITVAELAGVEVGSGEAHWRLVGGREASPMQPGAVSGVLVEDMAGVRLGDVAADRRLGGPIGSADPRVRVRVFYRACATADVASIGSLPWIEYLGPVRGEFGAIQVRCTVHRESTSLAVSFQNLRLLRWA